VDHFPIPIGQADAHGLRQFLHRPFQRRLLRFPEGGGEPPVCSKIRAAGPPSPKAAAHLPMVCGSRSSALATAEAVHPWASSQTACQRSRSRGVGARISLLCTSLAHISHCSRNPSIPLTPFTIPSRNLKSYLQSFLRIYLISLHISPWLWFSITHKHAQTECHSSASRHAVPYRSPEAYRRHA